MKKDNSKIKRRREIFGFMMFDFANSSYTTVVITAIFNAYFVRVVVNQMNKGEFLWSIALSISYALVIVLCPILGALADFSSLKKRFLFVSYWIYSIYDGSSDYCCKYYCFDWSIFI